MSSFLIEDLLNDSSTGNCYLCNHDLNISFRLSVPIFAKIYVVISTECFYKQ